MEEKFEIYNIFNAEVGCLFFHDYQILKKINFYRGVNGSKLIRTKVLLICKNCGKVKVRKLY